MTKPGQVAQIAGAGLGQGACIAVVNAVVLARAVTGADDIPAALRRWEAAERPYVDLTQRNS